MTVAIPQPKPLSGLTDSERTQLHKAVAQAREDYDADQRMLRTPFASPGYHTTHTGATVHETRQSLKFAVALLDTGFAQDLADAIDIFDKVISLQDQDPESDTYGIWPWFLEETIAEMDPPDWNWADFCGALLVEGRLTHASQLPPELLESMDAALYHASRSIQKRDVDLNYTNILVMGSFVTLMTGEILNDADLANYAKDRLKRFHAFTFEQGTFAEYNSPPYTNVTLNELRRLQRFVQDPELKTRVDELYELAWKEIALYYHPQSGQWAGPHSRCYQTLLTPQIEGNIQRALGREDPDEVPMLEQHRLSHTCPDKYRHYFDVDSSTAQAPLTVTKVFSKGPPEIVGTTYLHPKFTLGSVNYSDLFAQRRSLLAYWGQPEQARALRLRFLHDGYDFTTMQFYSTQQEGELLAGIGFATDGGDRHPHFDRLTDGQFEASDLRLRFEVEGATQDQIKTIDFDATQRSGVFKLDGIYFSLQTIEANFGGHQGVLEVTSEEGRCVIDLVFYAGPRKAFSLGENESTNQVSIAFSTSFSHDAPAKSRLTASVTPSDCGWTNYTWKDMRLAIRSTPAPLENMQPIPTKNH